MSVENSNPTLTFWVSRIPGHQSGVIRFDDFELQSQLLSAYQGTEIELPEFAREPEGGPALVKIHHKFPPEHSPQICERNISANRFQPHLGVEGKELPVCDKAVE